MIRCVPVCAVIALAACTSMPTAPPTTTPDSGAFANMATVAIAPVPDDWWRLYDDATLDRLVQASLSANVDLRIAYANLDAARATLAQARAVRLPQTVVESSVGVDDPAGQPTAAGVPSTDYDVVAAFSWEIDLFGRLRAGALAARADADAREAALDGLRVAIVADTVLAYIDLCGATRSAVVAGEVVASQERLVALLDKQLSNGEVSPLELSQAAALLEAARASLAPFAAARANALYRVALLQGLPPAAARRWRIECTAPPKLQEPIPVGDGQALVMRRPDIREAEHRLAAATARIGVARADLYPRVNLGGALGLLAGGFGVTASPLISWAFPNQVPTRARLAEARATEQAALAGWDVVVLRALHEVESALVSCDAEARRNAALEQAAHQAEITARRAAARVSLGDADPLLRLDAERSRADTLLRHAQSDLALAQAQIALFRALGGGWKGAAARLVQPVATR